VQLYQQTKRYPNSWGAARTATAINNDGDQPFEQLSRSNLRAWVEDGGMPDAARGVQVAEELGWTATEWTPTTSAFATLVAGVFACGSIVREWRRPSWSPDTAIGQSTIESALMQIGVGYEEVTREQPGHGDELRPRKHASILGRALETAGAPVGDKNVDSVDGLPGWLDEAPPSVRAAFAELVVLERAIVYDGKATRQIQEARPRQYFEDVRELLEDVTGKRVTASDAGVTISADAVRALGLR